MSNGDVSGPPAPNQTAPGPFTDANPAGIADGGITEAWRLFMHAIGRGVPDQINASKRGRIALRRLGRHRG